MLRKVFLHGKFAAFHEGPISIVGNTIAEVVEGITRQIKGFNPDPIHGRHRVKVVGCESVEDLYKPLGDQIEIHIVPQMTGGKKGGILQIILGAVLIAAGLFLGGAGLVAGLLIKAGTMMLLGGLAQLLAPSPDDNQDELKNRYLGAPKNTVKVGTRIPILYGRRKVYGHILSFDVQAIQSTKDA